MDKKVNAEILLKLENFYKGLGVRDYFSEAKFTLGILKSLQKQTFLILVMLIFREILSLMVSHLVFIGD